MKIVHITRRFVRSHWGGTETVVLQTCKQLKKRGHDAHILCPNALADENTDIIEGVRVVRKPYFYPYFGLKPGARELLDRKGGNLFSFELLKELNSESNLDLIHLHTAKRLGGIGRYAARKKGIPYVVSLHGGMFDVPAGEAATWTEPTRGAVEWGKLLGWWVGSRRVLDDAAAIICVGGEESVKTQCLYPAKKVVHLPNGVDYRHFASGDGQSFRQSHGIPLDAFVILTVGRIDPQKNQFFVIKHLPRLQQIHPKVHLVMVGPVTHEDYYSRILRHIEGEGMENRITIIPGLESGDRALVDAYHSADVFLLPSVHEPFGIVILEAWASGLPVVASRVGGIPSFVVPFEDGLLFESNDADSMIKSLELYAENSEEAKRSARAGFIKAKEQYGWDAITDRLMAVYDEALHENPFHK